MADEKPPEPREPATSQGAGRELSRARTSRRSSANTGRRHHIGAVPEFMPVWHPDGSVGRTRTSPAQLADRTVRQLQALLVLLEREMAAAATDLDFEQAAHLRDEAAAARDELGRRGAA